jgi:DNA-directed RNA polymerase
MNELLEKQKLLEQEMHDGGIKRWNARNQSAIDGNDASSTDWNVKLTKNFIHPLSMAIEAWLEEYRHKKGRPTRVLYYLEMVDSREAAFITIRQMLNAIAIQDTTSLQHLSDDIASKIEDQVRFSELRSTSAKIKKYLDKIDKSLKQAKSSSYKHRKNVYASAARKVGSDNWVEWERSEKLHLGSFLIKMACQMVQLWDEEEDELEPLFYIDEIDISRGKIRKSSKVLGITSKYAAWVSEFISETEAFHPEVGPCLVPPRDWRTPFNGGFHTSKVASRNPMIKMRDKELARTMTQKQMPLVYKALRGLQNTKWKVNTEVLDVLQEICEKQLTLAVPSISEGVKPLNPIDGVSKFAELKGDKLKEAMTAEEYSDFITWKRETKTWHEAERSRISNVVDLGRTRRLAEKYSHYDSFYYVYSLDFRQRFYPRASGLSPHGGDIQKGLLRFADRKALGNNGHFWFLIHGANVWDKKQDGSKGLAKESFVTRLQAVDDKDFEEMCITIAKNPCKHTDWIRADKPWQFLSWCFEFADYLAWKKAGKDTKDFKTFIAAAMDGSCSGIQHYSAMLRDEVGGKAVNLVNSDKPNDIYNEVSEETYTTVKIASKNGEPYADGWLQLGWDRSLPKSPTMTLVYGSSKLTCRDSMGVYLDDRQASFNKENKANGVKGKGKKEIPVHSFGDDRWLAEGFMSRHVWDAIGNVVVAARQGMSFLQKVARFVSKQGEPLIWTTKTGFIIKQLVYKTEGRRVDTNLLGRINFEIYEETDQVCTRKMQSGLPPNFIHGQDSSHLVMAVCDMMDRGITQLWVVHDDFGTYCCQTGHLHISLRVTFVELYKDCPLEEFITEQEERLNMDIDIDLPERGTLDINCVLTSTYMFS